MATGSKREGDSKQTAPEKSVFSAPSITLPKGGGAIRGIGEKFAANPVTGTGSMTVPIATSPGRSGFGPQLALSYDSGSGNGPFGFGWSLSLPSITRKTDKGLPQYFDGQESDVFILSGAEDLVPVLQADGTRFEDCDTYPGYTVHRYRPRIEGLFARIERWTNQTTGEIHWRSISKDNITTLYGKDNTSRIFDPAELDKDDPTDLDKAHPTRIFSWLICQSFDDKGNAVIYEYQSENSQRIFEDQQGQLVALAHENNRNDATRLVNRYLKRVKYGNRKPNRDENWNATDPAQLSDWMFELVLDYGEGHYEEMPLNNPSRPNEEHQYVRAPIDPQSSWPARQDPFSSYRAGFEVRTYRLCRRALMFHHFPAELGTPNYLVRSTEFIYTEGPVASFITGVTQSGYVRQPVANESNRYLKKSLPPLEFEYSQVPTPEQLAAGPIREVDAASLENLPIGLDGSHYQWMDLDGEGTYGILTEQADGWYYKRNLSANHLDREKGCLVARFGPAEVVARKPAVGLASGGQFLDLAGDGQVDLVTMEGPTRGFYERTDDAGWAPFRPFVSWPNLNTRDQDSKFVDLTGDGHADILITEAEGLSWHESLAEEGFGPAVRLSLPLDEEQGPRLVFADGTQSIYLADLSGDGLSDLVRIRNGEVCYWPNLGYGRFGAKVTMDNAPWFDSPDQFDQRRIRLADTDGSGTTDILYLRRDGVQIYFNQSGNGWSEPVALPQFPAIDNLASVQALDLLGNDTACLVWSSPLACDAGRSMRYIAMMEDKPHLLVSVKNNLGAETKVHYAPSTKFYLDDKREGKPWITRLPFPVHVVNRVETYDRISRNRFVTRYTYHHGYFDGQEREFRGFGMVEQRDTEEIGTVESEATDDEAVNWDVASFVPPVLTRTWFHTGVYLGRDHVSNFFAGLLDAHDRGEYYREPAWRDDDKEARKHLLDDTMLPDELSAEEEREACRALKGSMLRQEVYALDGSEKAEHPYTVTEQNFAIQSLQQRGNNRHAVFFTHAHEAITYHYERNPADPRIQHALTLEVDRFGNVLKSAAIGYGRCENILVVDEHGAAQIPNPGLDQLDPGDRAKQTQTLVTYTENQVTNPIDDAAHPDDYRTPLPCETRTYELTGYTPSGAASRFQASDLVVPDLDHAGSIIQVPNTELQYEEQPTGGKQRRLIEQVRTLYRKDDLSACLPPGMLGPLALPCESYKLAFTPGLLAQVYQRPRDTIQPPGAPPPENLLPDPAAVLLVDAAGGQAADRGGYVDLDSDGHWWIPSGRVFYSPASNDAVASELAFARTHFFLPHRYRDPFYTNAVSTESTVTFDDHNLLMVETHDALGNTVHAQNDYRVLQPALVTDPNGNCSQVIFDALGMVVATAVMGKPGENKGDHLDSTFEPDLTLAQTQKFIKDPRGQAQGLLKSATTRIVYDLDRYQRCQEPPFAATLAREIHTSDPGGGNSPIQISFLYSDGFDREVQTKVQAEPGDAPQRQPEVLPVQRGDPPQDTGDIRPGPLVLDANGKPVSAHTDHRWVGTGRIVYNNKGKPIKKYEPFFSSTHLYEPESEMTDTGVTPILFYDPVERVVATLHPNHTYEKVVFDPWQQTTYDVNDTVTFDPKTDPNVGSFFTRLPEADFIPTWYQQRTSDTAVAEDKVAANKAAKHADTPTVAHFDTLGRTFLTCAHNRFERDGVVHDDIYPTRVEIDIEGNQREVRDELTNAQGVREQRIVMRYDYDMLSNRVHQASMEAGERWMLNDVLGKPIRAWDSRGFTRRITYDQLRRPLELFVSDNSAPDLLAEKTVYGESKDNSEESNHRTRVWQVFDGSGIVTSEKYDFKGNLLKSTRDLLVEYKTQVNWLQKPTCVEEFAATTTYDALNRPTAITTPDNSVYRPTYNEANLLDKVEVNLRGAETATPFVTNIDYNAKGQRERIDYGNGASTRYDYDPLTFRLIHLLTIRGVQDTLDCAPSLDPRTCQDPPAICSGLLSNKCILQNLYYAYDPAGNITHIRDDAQQTIYFRNKRVEPSADYTYDAIYRLIEASGREHLGQIGGTPVPTCHTDAPRVGLEHPGDGRAMGLYREIYTCDEVGNLKELRHVGTDPAHPGWSRSYHYQEPSLIEHDKFSNRLTSTTVGTETERYTYNEHGDMTSMSYLPSMSWDFKDQLQRVDLGGGGTAYYTYDASGQRVRKVINRQTGTRQKERIYLGSFEVYREYNGADGTMLELERETLKIMEDQLRLGNSQRHNYGTQTLEPLRELAYPSGLGNYSELENEGNSMEPGHDELRRTNDKWCIALVETRTRGSDGSPTQLIRYQFGDHLGSTSLELDDQAQIISYEAYFPFGNAAYQAMHNQNETPKRYQYSGKERDEESGLYYYGARYYAPWISRWTSCDPIGVAGGPNLYIAFWNNPVVVTDPTGQRPPPFRPLPPSQRSPSPRGPQVLSRHGPGARRGPFSPYIPVETGLIDRGVLPPKRLWKQKMEPTPRGWLGEFRDQWGHGRDLDLRRLEMFGRLLDEVVRYQQRIESIEFPEDWPPETVRGVHNEMATPKVVQGKWGDPLVGPEHVERWTVNERGDPRFISFDRPVFSEAAFRGLLKGAESLAELELLEKTVQQIFAGSWYVERSSSIVYRPDLEYRQEIEHRRTEIQAKSCIEQMESHYFKP